MNSTISTTHLAGCLVALALAIAISAAAEPLPSPAWRTIEPDTRVPDRFYLHVQDRPADGRLLLPTPFGNVVRTYRRDDPSRRPLPLIYNEDGTAVAVQLPAGRDDTRAAAAAPVIVIETAEKTVQYPDGVIILAALDADITGDTAKLESQPGHHRIEHWTNPLDTVGWQYKPTRWGMYEVELTYALADGDGTKIKAHLGGTVLGAELKATGSWQQYTTMTLGRVYFETAQPKAILLRCQEKTGRAVMRLKALILRPAPEGEPIVQGEDKSITLHAHDATVSGVTLRYEPRPEKNTLGYWSNVNDRAYWDFEITTPGRFTVEVLQGCGKGQGGSNAAVVVDDQQLDFVVEDTGHFQNFKARDVGEITITEPGTRRLTIKALKKAKGAVMDVRRIRLIPAP